MVKHFSRIGVAALVAFVGCATATNEEQPKVTSTGPARESAAPMHVHVVSKGSRAEAAPSGPNVDWNVTTTSPVKTAPAVTGPSFTAANNTDVFAFGVSNTGTTRGITGSSQLHAGWAAAAADAGIFVLTNLYDASTKPDLLTYALDNQTSEKFTSGGLVFNIAGSKLYALSQTGKLFCFAVPAGGPVGGAATRASACAGWTDYTGGSTVTVSSIWPVYDGTGAVTTLYFGDDSGKIHKVNGTSGATQWGANGGTINSPATQLGPPVVMTDTTTLNNVIYVGDNRGRYFRLVDTGSTPTTASPSSYDLCGGGPGSCATNYWGVVTSPTIDATAQLSYVASGGRIFEFPVSSSATWAPNQPAKILIASPTAQIYSNPILDPDNNWLYVGHNNRLYKVKYPFDGSTSTNIYSTTLQKSGPDASYPRGQALPYLGKVWIGSGTGTDGNGLAEQYGCGSTANATAPALQARSLLTYGAYVGTPMVFDYETGNVNFGYQNAAGTAGGAVQYKSTGSPDWDCGTQTSIAGLACGSAGCATGCAVAGDCPGTNQSTVSCTAPTCGGTCSAGYADCNANKNTDGCEINTNTDVSNCGGCGTTCSTNHIFSPTCTTGTCGGACDVGYYNCNGTIADGCEGNATCTDCCGVACGAGNSCVAGACSPFTGGTVAYSVPNGTVGNQSWPYGLGMDFDVNSEVTVTQLGAFDSGSNGLSSTITVFIYDRDTQQQIASLTFTPGSPGTLVGGSRYKALTCPVSLPAGFHGKVVADGYSASEPNGNGFGGAVTWTTNTMGGKITYVNSATYSNSAGVYPTNIDGGPANRYAAGTFVVGTGGGCAVAGDCPGSNQSSVTCAAGVCGGTCSAGYADCNGSKNTDGCETPTTSDANNCGGCGVVCSTNHISSPGCTAGVCQTVCSSGYANCNGNNTDGCEGNSTCADCCGVACSGGTPVCSAGVCVALPTTAVAYVVNNGTVGSQTYTGSIGMDFDVSTTPIMVTELGVFDSSQNGLGGTVNAYIYNRATQTSVATLSFTTGSPGTLTAGSRFKSLACPVVLPAGFQGSIVIDSGNELNGNTMGAAATNWSTNTNGGLISFTGSGRYGTTGAYPATADGGPANRYAGGTFRFAASP